MKEIQQLQNRIEYLEKENQYLKTLLDKAGVPYEVLEHMEKKELYDPNQGARIIHKEIFDASMQQRYCYGIIGINIWTVGI